jgi:hypothetical protein
MSALAQRVGDDAKNSVEFFERLSSLYSAILDSYLSGQESLPIVVISVGSNNMLNMKM